MVIILNVGASEVPLERHAKDQEKVTIIETCGATKTNCTKEQVNVRRTTQWITNAVLPPFHLKS